MSKLCLTYFITFGDFVLPGLRCVMAAKRAVLEAGLYEPAIRSIVHKYTYMYSLFCQRCPCGYMLLDFKYQNEAFSDRVGGLRDGGQLQPIF